MLSPSHEFTNILLLPFYYWGGKKELVFHVVRKQLIYPTFGLSRGEILGLPQNVSFCNLKTKSASHFSGQFRKEILIHSQRPQVMKVADGRR